MEYTLSYWQQNTPEHCESLQMDTDADVVVIGGGMAGLGTAFHLLEADPGLDLILVEAEHIGFGASGRNAGIIESPLSSPIWLFNGALPQAEARWALSCLHARIERQLQRLTGIAVHGELRRVRTLISATSRLASRVLDFVHEKLKAAQVPAEWIGPQDLQDRCGALGHGALDLGGYTLNPVGLARDLRQSIQSLGARIFEKTRILQVTSSGRGRVELITQTGLRIRARVAVLCTGAWTRQLRVRIRPRMHLFYDYMLASEPLDDGLLERLGGDNCSLSEVFPMSYRRVHQRRLLFGGLHHWVSNPEPETVHDRKRIKRLVRFMAGSLPWLKDVKLTTYWGGAIGSSRHGVPVIMMENRNPGVIYNYGFQGVMPAFLSGGLVQGLVLGRSHRDEEAERLRQAYRATRMPWIRSLATMIRLLVKGSDTGI